MRPGLLSVLFLPLLCGFTPAPPSVLLDAMEIDPADVIPGSVSTTSAQTAAASDPNMFSAITALGPVQPVAPADMALLFTGDVELLPSLQDWDYPSLLPMGSAGDHATLRLRLQVPDDANAYCFRWQFLSREYPEWIGSEYNDAFEVWADNPAWSGQIVFDAAGNPVNINSTLFGITAPALMANTGFDDDGRSGWVTTIAPADPGTELELSFEIYDVSDGLFDSAVLLDAFEWKALDVDDPVSDPGNDGPLRIAYLSPKEGHIDAGYGVSVVGVGFDEQTVLRVDGDVVPATPRVGGQILDVAPEDWPAVDTPRTVDVEVQRGAQVRLLEGAFTYHDSSKGLTPPRITWLSPVDWPLTGGLEVRLEGEGISPGATVALLDDFADEVETLNPDWSALGEGQELVFVTPPLEEGWYEVIVINPDGGRTSPGYPVLATVRANLPAEPRGCGCSAGGGAGLPLLLLLGVRRRR